MIEIDFEELDKLLYIQCTAEECAYFFGCSEDTLGRRIKEKFDITFAEYKKQKGARGRISLRRKQFETALKGNVTMMIWLGKQILNQADKSYEHEVDPATILDDDNPWQLEDPNAV
jgi:hypothetical protein